LHSEINKLFIDRINDAKAKYFVFDIADIRFDYLELTKPAGVRIYKHRNAIATLNNANGEYEWLEKSYLDIPMEEWYALLDKFVSALIGRYDIDNIIMVKIPVAKYYYENGEKVYFSKENTDIKFEPLVRVLEEYVASKLKKGNIVETKLEVVSDTSLKLGVGPLHYTPEIYIDLASQVEAIVNRNEEMARRQREF